MNEYNVILNGGSAEVIEKKSRFIGQVFTVDDPALAQEYVNEVVKKHYDAKHHCYAYIIGMEADGTMLPNPILKASDNGEPQGTAGKPILEVIRGAGLTNTLIVVTRYFGGVLLGTGGLVRAYTQAAQEALKASKIGVITDAVRFEIRIAYNLSDKIQHYIRINEISAEAPVYAADVSVVITVKRDDADHIHDELVQMTDGKAQITKIEEGFFSL